MTDADNTPHPYIFGAPDTCRLCGNAPGHPVHTAKPQMVESFGYSVLSLDGLILRLSQIKASHPELVDKPVWIGNLPPMYWPVKQVNVARTTRGPEIMVYVEKG